jgi:diaminopimelate decarboxylase
MDRAFIQSTMQAAISSGLLAEESPVVAFVHPDGIRETIKALKSAFPDHFVHAFAAKANCMKPALELVRSQGMACEAASPGELAQAFEAGFQAGEIVYDEPAKTRWVLRRALDLGISINIDNFQEFERLNGLIGDRPVRGVIGFRINPQVGAGSIDAMSTATAQSKFGVALEDPGNHEQVVELYRRHEWLKCVHTHVGSQGCELDLLTSGIRKIVDLAEEINALCGCRRVSVIDIGGGLPVNFGSDEITPTFSAYAAALSSTVPELFTGHYRVITEFGRSVFAKNGFIVTRVEYTKMSGGRPIALTHAGAQLATRTVFMPDSWPLRLSVYDSNGRFKTGKTQDYDVAGPLCFAGDLIAEERPLPAIEPGDYIVLHDTGAYYFSNPFYYNALPSPAVYAASWQSGESVQFNAWRRQQTVDETLAVIG